MRLSRLHVKNYVDGRGCYPQSCGDLIQLDRSLVHLINPLKALLLPVKIDHREENNQIAAG